MTLIVVPAYGRDYKTSKEVMLAWAGNADFQIADITSRWHGSYVNLGDLRTTLGVSCVKIRYNRMQKTLLVDI